MVLGLSDSYGKVVNSVTPLSVEYSLRFHGYRVSKIQQKTSELCSKIN